MVLLHRIPDSDVRPLTGRRCRVLLLAFACLVKPYDGCFVSTVECSQSALLPGESAGTAITKQATALSHHISSRDQTSEERSGDGNGTAPQAGVMFNKQQPGTDAPHVSLATPPHRLYAYPGLNKTRTPTVGQAFVLRRRGNMGLR